MSQHNKKNKYSLDYSKWDHIGEDEDDGSDDDDETNRESMARVTRLDQPSSVTLLQDGSLAVVVPVVQPVPTSPYGDAKIHGTTKDTTTRITNATNGATTTTASNSTTNTGAAAAAAACEEQHQRTIGAVIPASWTDKGAAVKLRELDRPPQQQPPEHAASYYSSYYYYWSQDRLAVHVRLPLDHVAASGSHSTRKFTVAVTPILPYADRYHAVLSSSQEPQRLVIAATPQASSSSSSSSSGSMKDADSTTTTVLLEGHLPHPVYLAEEDETVDWCVVVPDEDGTTTIGFRYILVTLYKATPMAGMTLWWKKALQEDPTEIELTWVAKNTAFQQAWDQAHEQFRESVDKNPKYSV